MYKVLIVEDEDIIRKGLMFMVNWQEAGCVVVGEGVDGEEQEIEIVSRIGNTIYYSTKVNNGVVGNFKEGREGGKGSRDENLVGNFQSSSYEEIFR